MGFKEAWEKARYIDGWLDKEEAELLYNHAKECIHDIIEIGSFAGRSTICLAQGSIDGKKALVWAVDPFDDRPRFMKNTENEFYDNLKDYIPVPVSMVVNTSTKFAKTFFGKVGLLFIDGNHEYEEVKKDFEAWWPKLVPGGIIVFHDATGGFPGPSELVIELEDNGFFGETGKAHNCFWAKKHSKET